MSRSEHIRCRDCRALNDPGSVFCARCGSSLRGQGQRGVAYRPRRRGPGRIFLRFALALVLIGVVLGLAYIVLRSTSTGQGVASNSSVAGTLASTSTTLASAGSADSSPDISVPASGDTTPTSAPLSPIRPQRESASSSLSPTGTNNFRAQNLSDDDLTTVWSEGASGPGLGEWVRFDFARSVQLVRLEIANGDQKSKTLFTADPRVHSLRIEYSNGSVQIVDLRDIEDFQFVNTLQKSTDWIRLTILSVYSSYTTPNTSLSEVRFYELPAQL